MACVDVVVPELAESIVEGTLGTWHVLEGNAVSEGDVLVDLETDKVTLEIESPATGKLIDVKASEGQDVRVGEVVARIEVGAAGTKKTEPKEATTPPREASSKESSKENVAETSASSAKGTEEVLSPAVARLLAEKGLDPADIPHRGPKGNLLKGDVLEHLGGALKPKPVATAPVKIPEGGEVERVKMSRLRQTIAARLRQAEDTAVMLTTFNEVDMTRVIALRATYKASFEKKYHARLGFMSFFVKAAVEALREYPVVNAMLDGDTVVYQTSHDIGIAVGSEKGLVVPVVRNADTLSFREIEEKISDFGRRAAAGKLSLGELQGGTFTITNGGVFGSLLSTPILNTPQSAILGMHGIRKRPICDKEGNIIVGNMMYLALTYDHRLIDGREAVLFLRRIVECMEDPDRLLLGI